MVAKRLGSGLQNRLNRSDSDPRLHFFCPDHKKSGGCKTCCCCQAIKQVFQKKSRTGRTGRLLTGIPGSLGLPVSHTAEQQRQKLQAAVISQYFPILPKSFSPAFPSQKNGGVAKLKILQHSRIILFKLKFHHRTSCDWLNKSLINSHRVMCGTLLPAAISYLPHNHGGDCFPLRDLPCSLSSYIQRSSSRSLIKAGATPP